MSGTGQRRNTAALVAGELAQSAKPMSAYDLLERLRPSGVFAPSTVYRALDKLLVLGKVHRIESLNAFVACRGRKDGLDGHAQDHIRLGTGFTICDRCATVSEFEDASLKAGIETAVASGSFQPRMSVVEIHGLCAACAVEGASEP